MLIFLCRNSQNFHTIRKGDHKTNTLFIDADGCPVTELACKIARENSFRVVVVCDTAHIMDIERAETITVSKGRDSADFVIVNKLCKNDTNVVVTQDYGLAAMCLAKGATVINQNGLVFTNENIGALLEVRAFSGTLRRQKSKIHLKGPSKRTADDDKKFAESFYNLLKNTKK